MRNPARRDRVERARARGATGPRASIRRLRLPFLFLVGGGLVLGIALADAAPNTPPVVVTSPGTLAYTEDDGPVVWDAGVLVDDADGDPIQSATVRVSAGYVAGEDVLGSAGGGGVAASWDAAAGTLTLTGAAPASTYQLVLRQVTYENTSAVPSTATRTVEVVVSDGIDPSAPATRDVAVTSVHDDPVVTTTSGSLAYTEGSGAVAIDVGATMVDPEDDVVNATLQITGGYVNGEDLLAYSDALGITSAWAPGSGTLTLTGSAASSAWQSALRAVTYANSSNNPATAPRTITIVVNDGLSSSGPAVRVVAITAVNNAPSPGGDTTVVAPGGGAVSILEDTPTPSAPNIRLAPPTLADAEGPVPNAVRVLAVTGGTLTQGDGSAIGLGAGGSLLTLTTGGVDLRLTPVADRDTNATFTYVVVDGANPGLNSGASTATVPITPVNDAPVLSLSGGSAAFVEGAGAVVVDPAVDVDDVDDTMLVGATVTIAAGYVASEDVLASAGGPGISAVWDAPSGSLTLAGAAPLATYQSVLQAVTYANTSDNPTVAPRTVSIVLDDGSDSSAVLTRPVTVAATNDAPVVTPGPPGASYAENGPAVPVDPAVAVADVDSPLLTGATAQVTGSYASGEDVLGYGGAGGLTAVWDGASGTLTLIGAATPTTYEQALRSITYADTSDAPSTATRTISFTVNDGSLGSTAATQTVDVVASNDAPTLAGSGGTLAVTENDPPVPVDPGVAILDLDDTMLAGATVRITSGFVDTEDVLGFTDQAGISGVWSAASGTLTLSGAATLAEYDAALESVTYVNVSDDPSTSPRTVEMSVADPAAPSNTVTRTVAITAVNDPATVTLAASDVVFVEDDPATAIDDALTVADLDDPNLTSASVRATGGWSTGEDELLVTPPAGITATYDAASGELTLTGPAAPATFENALRTVRFANSSPDPVPGARTFEFTADDGAGDGPAGARTVTVNAVNDAPIARNDSAEVVQGEAVTVDVLVNDSDADGDPLTVSDWTDPLGATVTVAAGALRVEPAPGYAGSLTVDYEVSDGAGGTDTARLRVRVTSAADGSVALFDTPDPLALGTDLEEIVVVHNDGPGSLERGVVRLRIPGAQLAAAPTDRGIRCNRYAEHWACALADLPAGDSLVLRFTVRPRAAGTLDARAELSHRSTDRDDGDLAALAVTEVRAPAPPDPDPGTDPPADPDDGDGGGGDGIADPDTTTSGTPVSGTPASTTSIAGATTTIATAPTPTTETAGTDVAATTAAGGPVPGSPEPQPEPERDPATGSSFPLTLTLAVAAGAVGIALLRRQRL
jgi:hypothetical protein